MASYFYRVVCALLVLGVMVALISPPNHFPSEARVTVLSGESAGEVARSLAEARVIKYERVFVRFLQLTGKSDEIYAGTYLFVKPQGLIHVATRLTSGDTGLTPVTITFPEGITIREMAERVHAVLPHITTESFVSEAKGYEGYLFPDTYRFLPSATAEIVVETLRDTFEESIEELDAEIRASGHTEKEIITMASLLEKEARTPQVRRVVAGILWDRLELGMPLQVDAVFGYIFNRSTYSPSFEDLKTDSPYNTYKYKGLPPTPINNPGLESIRAALEPTESDYLYYLTGSDGTMHYAKTYAGHQENERRYLR